MAQKLGANPCERGPRPSEHKSYAQHGIFMNHEHSGFISHGFVSKMASFAAARSILRSASARSSAVRHASPGSSAKAAPSPLRTSGSKSLSQRPFRVSEDQMKMESGRR
ncbi:uncharacterized protein LOC119981794 [Tripterygium wilfordii]|uniref:uncharacterized protein LOC119981794 n=1 Tax=Tripterygium wilfordii TaxID=458696 RepID=UPI0018F82199|nr:uncharacterized protein LOC119981794 [Tripterygium wilfordii]